MLEQTSSFQLQVCLSICELLVDTRHQGVNEIFLFVLCITLFIVLKDSFFLSRQVSNFDRAVLKMHHSAHIQKTTDGLELLTFCIQPFNFDVLLGHKARFIMIHLMIYLSHFFNRLNLVPDSEAVFRDLLEKSCSGNLKIQKHLPEVFRKKSVLRNFVKFTGKHLCHSLCLQLY